MASGDLMVQEDQLQLAGKAGLGFSSVRTWNSLGGELQEYGKWSDSNANEMGLAHFADGTLGLESGSGSWFTFIRESNGAFITPSGIKAMMCERGSPSPCPSTLPEGVKFRLIFEPSETHIDYAEDGIALYEEDRYHNKISLEFPTSESKVYTDTQGRKIEELSNPAEFITEIKDLSGKRNMKYTYASTEAGEEPTSFTDAAGSVTKYAYEGGNLSKITDPRNDVTEFAYDGSGRVTEVDQMNSGGTKTVAATKYLYYGGSEELGEHYCASGQQKTLVRDPDWEKPAGEKTGKEFKLAAHETLYCSNVLDQVEKTFDANGNETQASYDPYGNQLSQTAAARETGGKGGVTSAVYGEAGVNLDCEVTGTTTSESSCPGRALPKGYATESKYEDSKFPYQPSTTISARRQTSSYCYWGGGTSCEGVSGEGATGQVKQITDPLSAQNKSTFNYNSAGQPTAATDPDGHTTTYAYESAGNLESITPPAGSGIYKTTIVSDADGRPKTIAQCLNESCSSSRVSSLKYNANDQVTEALYTGPGTTKTFKYTYDGDGNLEKREDPTGTTKFTRDALGRITEEALPASVTNSYSYDAASNLASFTEAGGTSEYKYNGLNQLEAMNEPGGNCGETPSKCTRFEYDGDGSLTKTTFPSKATINYTVDPSTGRPTAITVRSPAGETLLSHTYAYTSEGNDTPLIYEDAYALTGTGTSSTKYEYDPLDRLAQATTTSTAASMKSHYQYAYDGAGNRTEQQISTSASEGGTNTYYRYNAGNELECRMKTNEACSKSNSTELANYSYDGTGNETEIDGYNEPEDTPFTYNNLNQLKTITPPSLGEQAVTYIGSGQNNLTSLGTIKLQNSLLGTTKQVNTSGTSYYARTPSGLMIDERLPSGTNYNPIYDTNNDLIGLLNTSGELVQTIRYGPYGENANTTGTLTYSPTNDPFLYQNGYHLAGGDKGEGNIPNDLYHYGERYYDPTTGRWTQLDPQGSGYAFVTDDPVNDVDPSGEKNIGEEPDDIEDNCPIGAIYINYTCVKTHPKHHPAHTEAERRAKFENGVGAYQCAYEHDCANIPSSAPPEPESDEPTE